MLGLCATALLLGSGGTLILLTTAQVSDGGGANYRFEPSSAAGSTTWATSWTDLPSGKSYVTGWNGSSWRRPATELFVGDPTLPTYKPMGDVYLTWDSTRNRFVFVALDVISFSGPQNSIWYGYSTDASGTSWVFGNTDPLTGAPRPVMASDATVHWDYPSVGVDGLGRIIVGAAKFAPNDAGFYTKISYDGGSNFNSLVRVGTSGGARSRVVATDNMFHAFVPSLRPVTLLPYAIVRYESTTGTSWGLPIGLRAFDEPKAASPDYYSGHKIHYSPLLDARGYTNGLWSVAFQESITFGATKYNNVEICTSDRGCGMPDQVANDQFLTGTSVSGDSGYWLAYLTYHTPRQLNLDLRAVYFPPGQSGVYGIPYTGINPLKWRELNDARCGVPCYSAGDYAGIASNPYAGASTPFVQEWSATNILLNTFLQDPPVSPNIPNFKGNFVAITVGSDTRSPASVVGSEEFGREYRASEAYLRHSGEDLRDPISNRLSRDSAPYPIYAESTK